MKQQFITRQRRGKGFAYYKASQLVTDTSEVTRIRKLAIPPAWSDVKIASDTSAKILASGIDDAGRRQAIYHPDFRTAQDEAKFKRILLFGQQLPKLRRQVGQDLARRRLGKEKVLACIVKLMDEAYFRVGNQQYAKQHQHYGLTTLRSKHANTTTTSVTFDFIGKSGQRHHKVISDRQIARIIKQLDELPGYEIFKYIDDAGQFHTIDSQDVNDYIKQYMGEAYSAKDFRTWGGTLLAAAELAAAEAADTAQQRQKITAACVKKVAQRLGNTPAVTRSSYIDPRIMRAYESNALVTLQHAVQKMRPRKFLKPEEQLVLKLLNSAA